MSDNCKDMKMTIIKFLASAPTVGRNTDLLAQRDARICTNLQCDNCDYMELVMEHCPVCHKKTKLTTKQQEPPYVKCD